MNDLETLKAAFVELRKEMPGTKADAKAGEALMTVFEMAITKLVHIESHLQTIAEDTVNRTNRELGRY